MIFVIVTDAFVVLFTTIVNVMSWATTAWLGVTCLLTDGGGTVGVMTVAVATSNVGATVGPAVGASVLVGGTDVGTSVNVGVGCGVFVGGTGVGWGVLVGGIGVFVGGTGVGGTGVRVGLVGRRVFVGGTGDGCGVSVGGTGDGCGVSVGGTGVAVGGTRVLVGGTGVGTGAGFLVGVGCAMVTRVGVGGTGDAGTGDTGTGVELFATPGVIAVSVLANGVALARTRVGGGVLVGRGVGCSAITVSPDCAVLI